jgi:ammonia channel protein AmtB
MIAFFNAQTVSLIIVGVAGLMCGGIIGTILTGIMSARAVARAEREAWKSADRYYKRKPQQP